jgi:hypothetical protein
VWQFSPELVLTGIHICEKTRPNDAVAVAAVPLVGKEATPVCNVLLSMFALLAGGLPETASSDVERDVGVAAVFREIAAPLPQTLPRPVWLNAARPDQPVIRGQGPGGTYESPPMTAPLGTPYQPQTPFSAGPDPVLPYLNDPGPTVLSGINGPQPQRFGFTPVFDGAYIGASGAKSPGQGRMAIQEYDAALKHVSMLGPDWVFSNTAQGGARLWDGPDKPNLPGAVYRFGWDFLLSSPQIGAWSAQLDFNPSINTDFGNGLGRESLNLDGSATLFYRVSPQWLLVLGAQYWDRVDNILIPNAGVVWNPNERLELRLLFPKSRISYFVGNFGNGSHWLYATGEYHVESYQVRVPGVADRDQIQLSDWRIGVGLRSDHTWYDKYIEVGYVFHREAEFLRSTPGFNLNDGLMARFGVRF